MTDIVVPIGPPIVATVVVEDAEQACAAAAAASAAQVRLDIRSAEWLAPACGPMVFAAMIEAAYRAAPEADVRGILDCGDSAGLAMAALRHGLDVRTCLGDPVRGKLADMARQSGRAVVSDEGPVLHLVRRKDPLAACAAWFAALASGTA